MAGSLAASRTCRVCDAITFSDQAFCGECGASLDLESALPAFNSAQAVADPLVGRVLADRYRIVRCIGRGGMGVVYEVEHVHIGKRLAMKLLHGDLAGDPDTVRKLRREAEAASRLSDPSTVQVFDFGQSGGLAYLVMELVDGQDLSQVLRREGTIPFERLARIVMEVCSSLAEAHSLGIVHRDLKPENVMVVETQSGERAKVLDFGLASLRASGNQSVSRTNAIVGTPHYMAPEQIRGDVVDGRTDIYSLGALMYRALTGEPPLTGETAIVVLTRHLSVMPSPPSTIAPGIDAEVDAIVMRCLAKSKSDRFADVHELAGALSDSLLARGIDGRRRTAVTSATGASTLASRVAAFATRRDIDEYERRLRRRSRTMSMLLALVALLCAGGAAYGIVRATSASEVPTLEIEPNGTPDEATNLAPGIAMRGLLGKRADRERGDVDVFRLVREDRRPIAIRASVSALPNMDIVLELYRGGEPDAILTVDEGHGAGTGESFSGFPLTSGEYFLVVREHWIRGTYPTENISDRYVLRWDGLEGVDATLDDSIERAVTIVPGSVTRSILGWASDVDFLCVDGPVVGGRWTVTPDAGLDVIVAELDATGDVRTEIDRGGPGISELLPIAVAAGARGCMRVSRKAEITGIADPSSAPPPGFGALLTVSP